MKFLKFLFFFCAIYLTKSAWYLPSFVPICNGLSPAQCAGWDGCSTSTCAGLFNISNFKCYQFWDMKTCQSHECQWNGCTGTNQGLACSLFYTDPVSCLSAEGRNCTWANGQCQGILAPQCGDFNSSKYCNLGSGCRWVNGECLGDFVNYQLCPNLGTQACLAAPGCLPNCTGTTAVICSTIMDELTCGAFQGCQYKNGFCTGTPLGGLLPCSRFSTNLCNTIPGCTLIPHQCSNYPCNATHSMEICVNTPGCWWHRGTCVWRGSAGNLKMNVLLVLIIIGFFVMFLS